MKKLFILFAIVISIHSTAQNVGIGTTSPQSTLDVKGNLRTGGISNFIQYDSLSGNITWINSNLWVTNPQYLMKHSASAEGLYSNGAQLEYRHSSGIPIFFTNWSSGNGYFFGNLGIGTVNPSRKLHVWDGASGITPFQSARVVVESNNHTYINLLSQDPFETGILFGSGTNPASGVISYNTSNTPKGISFADNGNLTRMVIDKDGHVGIGTTSPNALLSLTSTGTELTGTAMSSHFKTNAGILGSSGASEINLASIGFMAGSNNTSLGIRAYRTGAGTAWTNTALLLEYDVDNTPRPSSGFLALNANGNIGIGTANPFAKLHISAGDASFALFGPNSYGGMLYVGATPNNQNAAQTAQVIASDGNLHIDPASGKNIYVGYFQARDIYLNPNGGKVGIGTTIPAASLEVNGYTKLGSDAPSMKVKKLTGTTSATDGGSVAIAHGLTSSKILSVSVLVSITNGFIPPNYLSPGLHFYWHEVLGSIIVTNEPGGSAQILSKPFSILITYEE